MLAVLVVLALCLVAALIAYGLALAAGPLGLVVGFVGAVLLLGWLPTQWSWLNDQLIAVGAW